LQYWTGVETSTKCRPEAAGDYCLAVSQTRYLRLAPPPEQREWGVLNYLLETGYQNNQAKPDGHAKSPMGREKHPFIDKQSQMGDRSKEAAEQKVQSPHH
jgi:hypothetical protein